MKTSLVASFLMAIFCQTAGAASPSAVDPTLAIVSTQIETRVLVYSVCSPEHCWSESYFRFLSSEPGEPSVACTAEITEIFTGHSVDYISWSMVAGAPRIQIHVSASHGGFEPHTVTIIPLDGCRYSFVGPSAGT
jgi:hypothetical protein